MPNVPTIDPNNRAGVICATNMPPLASTDPVRVYTKKGSATYSIAVPNDEIVPPSQHRAVAVAQDGNHLSSLFSVRIASIVCDVDQRSSVIAGFHVGAGSRSAQAGREERARLSDARP